MVDVFFLFFLSLLLQKVIFFPSISLLTSTFAVTGRHAATSIKATFLRFPSVARALLFASVFAGVMRSYIKRFMPLQ